MLIKKNILLLLISIGLNAQVAHNIDFEDGDLSAINFNTPTTGYTYDIYHNHPDSSYYSPANGDSVLIITLTSGNYYMGFLTTPNMFSTYQAYSFARLPAIGNYGNWGLSGSGGEKQSDVQVGGNNSGRIYAPQIIQNASVSVGRVRHVWRDDDAEYGQYFVPADYYVGGGFNNTNYPSGARGGWADYAYFRVAESADDANDGTIYSWYNGIQWLTLDNSNSGSQGVDQIYFG